MGHAAQCLALSWPAQHALGPAFACCQHVVHSQAAGGLPVVLCSRSVEVILDGAAGIMQRCIPEVLDVPVPDLIEGGLCARLPPLDIFQLLLYARAL